MTSPASGHGRGYGVGLVSTLGLSDFEYIVYILIPS